MANLSKIPDKEENKAKKNSKKQAQENFRTYLKFHYADIAVYLVLVLGILLLFFSPVYGQIVVGLVAGVYFHREILGYLSQWKRGIELNKMGKGLVLGGIAVTSVISMPAFFIGMAIAVFVKTRI